MTAPWTVRSPVVELDSGPEAGRRFDYVLTHDRNLVLAGAQTLLERIAPT